MCCSSNLCRLKRDQFSYIERIFILDLLSAECIFFFILEIFKNAVIKHFKFHLQWDKVFLHEDGRDSTKFPQDVVVRPVQQHVENPRPELTPRWQGPRSAVTKAAQSPGAVGQGRDHIGVSLTHLLEMLVISPKITFQRWWLAFSFSSFPLPCR